MIWYYLAVDIRDFILASVVKSDKEEATTEIEAQSTKVVGDDDEDEGEKRGQNSDVAGQEQKHDDNGETAESKGSEDEELDKGKAVMEEGGEAAPEEDADQADQGAAEDGGSASKNAVDANAVADAGQNECKFWRSDKAEIRCYVVDHNYSWWYHCYAFFRSYNRIG